MQNSNYENKNLFRSTCRLTIYLWNVLARDIKSGRYKFHLQ